MRRLALVWTGVTVALLVAFLVAEALGLGAVTDPGTRLSFATFSAAVVGVGLLIADAVLPVPSSLVMVALGAVFGVVGGTVLSTLGGVGSLCLAGWIGRRCRPRMQRFLRDDSRRVEAFVARYGGTAVVVSRPVPVLAESVAIVAAASGMPPVRFLAAGIAGLLPLCAIYAFAGAKGGQANGLVLAAVLIGVSLLWLALNGARAWRRRCATSPRTSSAPTRGPGPARRR